MMRAEPQILNAAEAPSATPILEMRGISQIFPGVKALDGVDIALYPGKVTALIGENGAGKSTLVKILTGIYRPNEGEILLDGQPVNFHSAQDAIDAGVTAIHQETVLFDELSVGENIFLVHDDDARLDRQGAGNGDEVALCDRQVFQPDRRIDGAFELFKQNSGTRIDGLPVDQAETALRGMAEKVMVQ